ncbi:cobalamin biosynthesis protein [Sinorhizobium glycinis]|uniref:Cobalamin biosynthesis protein n=1 Tax=Sinorhizobium glycinis TaxID=1472378 RepID=A0A178Y568_9HYPH|nr:glycerophosphodiester phosphodiesterase family protein [Sinorhizobium glycinis]OAP42719.1 cobalamin biosynthesis protein [Sinorhizobium glycinis]
MVSNVWIARSGRKPLIIAHRGGAALAAENTVEALHTAQAAGADAIETDIRLTKDGAFVCMHDDDLRRLCGDARAVAEVDLATLRRLLPATMTLHEALAASGSLGVLLDIKLTDAQQVRRVIDEVVGANAAERTMLGLRSLDLIAAARSARANIAVLAFLEEPDSAGQARNAGAEWFRLWQGAASLEQAAIVRHAGLHLAIMVGQPRAIPLPEYPPFPVGLIDGEGLQRLRPIDADAILLDDPRLAAGCFR